MEATTPDASLLNSINGIPITQRSLIALNQEHNPTPEKVTDSIAAWLQRPAKIPVKIEKKEKVSEVLCAPGIHKNVVESLSTTPRPFTLQSALESRAKARLVLSVNGLPNHSSSQFNYILPIKTDAGEFVIKISGLNRLFHLVAEKQDPYINGGVQQFDYSTLDNSVESVHTLSWIARYLCLQNHAQKHDIQHVVLPKTYLIADQSHDEGTFIVQEEVDMELLEHHPERCADIEPKSFPELLELAKVGGLWNLAREGQTPTGEAIYGCKLGITPDNKLVIFNFQDPNNLGPSNFYNKDTDRSRANTVTGVDEFSRFLHQTYQTNPSSELAATLQAWKNTLEKDDELRKHTSGKVESRIELLDVESTD